MRFTSTLYGLALCAAIGVPAVSQAQQNMALADRGKQLFQWKQCYGCHAFGRHLAGPDLGGVTVRRSADWLRKFLADPEGMVATDSTARKVWEANKGYPVMRIQRLNSQEIEALIQYLQSEDAKARG